MGKVMRAYLQLIFIALLCVNSSFAVADKVALFVPGDTAFWYRFVAFSQAAAKGINLDLTIYNADLDRNKMLGQVREASESGVDAILFLDYEGIGESILKVSEKYTIPAFLVNTSLSDTSLSPRVHYKYWIGELSPDDYKAGLLLTERLLEAAREKGHSTFHILAYRGLENEISQIRRFEAVKEVASTHNDVTLTIIDASGDSIENTTAAFNRALSSQPGINIVWGVSDQVARHISQIRQATGSIDPIVFGGIDWDLEPLSTNAENGLDVNLGGHVFDGARAVIMVYDYLNGQDFADEGLSFHSNFLVVNPKKHLHAQPLTVEPDHINYSRLSKSLNPQIRQYQFDLENITKTNKKYIPLTTRERQWLVEHPVIRIGGEPDWPPYDFIDEQGRHIGVAADILKAIGDRLGVQFEVETGIAWESMLDQVRSGKLYAVCAIASTPGRLKDFIFTTPYALSPSAVITRTDNIAIESLSDLADKRVAIPAGFADIELLRARYPGFKHVKVNSLLEALQAVQNKQADAFFGSIEVAAYLMHQQQLTDLHVVVRDVPLRGNELRIGTSRSEPILASILQKGLNSLSLEETNVILKRWVTSLEASQATEPRVQLTDVEQAWLAAHPAVRFTGDPNWLPFEAFDEQGEYIGIVAEVLRLLESRTGLNFERIPSDTWLNAMHMANTGEVDVLSDHIGNDAVKDALRFTKPYLEYPMAIVMQDTQKNFIYDLYEIADKRIAVIEGYGYIWELYRKYPEINFVEVANIQEALLAVSTGSVDAFLASFNLSSYHINQMGLNNLRIAGQVPVTVRIGLGVRKDMPELYSILDKAIATLSDAEKFRLAESWMQEKYVERIDYSQLKWVLSIAGLLLFFIFFWNRLLKRQVERRTVALHQSQESLSKAQGIAHLGNWEWGFATDTVSWSDEVFRLFGYQSGAVKPTGKFFARHLHPDDHGIVAKAVKDIRSGKLPPSVVFRIIRKDRETRYVDVQAEAIKDNHSISGLFGTIQDITAQQQTEQALRQSEEHYRRFVETNTAGILNVEYQPPIPTDLPAEKQLKMLMENSYTIEVNAVLARQLGYSSPEDCRGKNLGFHIVPTDPNNIKNMLSYITSGYRVSGVVLHARNLNDEHMYFLNNAQGVVEGKLLKGTWLSLVDITQRLKSELALHTSEEKFSKAFDSSPDPMCITKLRDARFQYVNKSFEKISGYSKDEVLGRTAQELNLWDDSREGEKLRELLKTRTEIRELDMVFLTRSGVKRLTQISGGIFHFEEEPYLVLEIRDLTEKIGLERKTRQQELQLIQANKMTALGTLLSGVGHEINNPNNLVMMNGQILQDAWPDISQAMVHYHASNPAWKIAGLSFEEMKNTLPDLLSDIKDSAQRIQNIIGTLRDFVRPGQGDVQEEYQINDAVRRALPLLKYLIQHNTNHFRLQLADKLPSVMGNEQKVEQVIINLVINALESLPNRESAVNLSTRYNSSEKMVEIEVSDEGAGMSEEVLKQIRKPFYSTKLDSGGTGLGLAISDSLINEEGGYLTFISKPGAGTKVVIHVPVKMPD